MMGCIRFLGDGMCHRVFGIGMENSGPCYTNTPVLCCYSEDYYVYAYSCDGAQVRLVTRKADNFLRQLTTMYGEM